MLNTWQKKPRKAYPCAGQKHDRIKIQTSQGADIPQNVDIPI
jgi:hypothetical protein